MEDQELELKMNHEAFVRLLDMLQEFPNRYRDHIAHIESFLVKHTKPVINQDA